MVKHSREKAFTFRVENGYPLENFCGSMLVDLYCNQQGHNSWEKICD